MGINQNLPVTTPIETAREALQLIERFNLPPAPQVYELCYRCLTENKIDLRATFERLIERDGFVSDYEIENLRMRVVADSNLADQVLGLTESLKGEIDEIAKLIELSLIGTTKFRDTLTEAQSAMTITVDKNELKAIIQSALHAAAEMSGEEILFERALQQSKLEMAKLQDELSLARAESLADSLTGIPNRRHFDRYIQAAIRNAAAEGRPLALILADVDHFKRFNDEHGHLVGDHVLRLIAVEMKQAIKGQDFVARFGGEEFAIVLPHTNSDEAVVVANNIREQLAGRTILKRSTGETLGHITLSFGVSTWRPGMAATALIDVADKCLYTAKQSGRDRVVSEGA